MTQKGADMAHSKTTSKRVARTSSKVLRGNYSRSAKSAAGSALSQKHGKKQRR